MTFLNEFAREFSLFIGITPPKPEQERLVGVLIIAILLATVAGSVVLLLVMARVVLR
jgi:hypothetical protein